MIPLPHEVSPVAVLDFLPSSARRWVAETAFAGWFSASRRKNGETEAEDHWMALFGASGTSGGPPCSCVVPENFPLFFTCLNEGFSRLGCERRSFGAASGEKWILVSNVLPCGPPPSLDLYAALVPGELSADGVLNVLFPELACRVALTLAPAPQEDCATGHERRADADTEGIHKPFVRALCSGARWSGVARWLSDCCSCSLKRRSPMLPLGTLARLLGTAFSSNDAGDGLLPAPVRHQLW